MPVLVSDCICVPIDKQDVSGLFPDVLKNMQTDDLEQKKLVYLYLMNYAKTQPELVILAVNTFVKDTYDPNPLVRALAIRTMGCLRAEKIIDYLCDPLQKCLKDDNPYVRKTAALCVAKLYDLKPDLVIENGFLEQLRDMIADSNPMVRRMLVEAILSLEFSPGKSVNEGTDSLAVGHACGLFDVLMTETIGMEDILWLTGDNVIGRAYHSSAYQLCSHN